MTAAYDSMLRSRRQNYRARLGAASLQGSSLGKGSLSTTTSDYDDYRQNELEYPDVEETQPAPGAGLTLRQKLFLKRRLRRQQLLRLQQIEALRAAASDYDYGDETSRIGVTGSGSAYNEPEVQYVYKSKSSCYTGINLVVAFATAAAAVLAFYFIFVQLTMGTNKRRRSFGKSSKKVNGTEVDEDEDMSNIGLNKLFWIGTLLLMEVHLSIIKTHIITWHTCYC